MVCVKMQITSFAQAVARTRAPGLSFRPFCLSLNLPELASAFRLARDVHAHSVSVILDGENDALFHAAHGGALLARGDNLLRELEALLHSLDREIGALDARLEELVRQARVRVNERLAVRSDAVGQRADEEVDNVATKTLRVLAVVGREAVRRVRYPLIEPVDVLGHVVRRERRGAHRVRPLD